MERKVVDEILQSYGLVYRHILPLATGYRNHVYPIVHGDGRMVNLIIYKTESRILTRIKTANRVGDFLAERGLPARSTFDSRIIRLASPQRVRYAALYTYLPGETIPWEAYTMERIKSLGAVMSTMHHVLADYSGRLLDVTSELTQIAANMNAYFANDGVGRALTAKLNLNVPVINFQRLLTICRQLPGRQALHLDFVRGNVLFQGEAVSGILDFEKAAAGHTIIDIARTLAFLLVDCKHKSEEKIRKYFLHSGYTKRGPQAFKNIKIGGHDLLEKLLDFFLLHDFYKLLRHNPYDFLPTNEHFERTRELLLKRQVIRAANDKL